MARRGVDVGTGAEIVDDCSDEAGTPCPGARQVFGGLVQLPAFHQLVGREVGRVVSAARQVLDR